jgi:phosphoribosylformylglycinamidine synthase subunit PurSL
MYQQEEIIGNDLQDPGAMLLQLLSHPNVCSREDVVRQYDHEVQGASVVKPLMGPLQKGACDAAVITPVLGKMEGLSISNGICPQLSEYDPHLMAVCAVDEAIRNAVCVGADPDSIVLLDNFCWPDPVVSERNPDGKRKLAQLVMTCQGLAEAVIAYGTPLISGKDSMKNDFDDQVVRLSIPPTLLVSAMGRLESADQALTMEFKSAGDLIFLVSAATLGLAHSLLFQMLDSTSNTLPEINPERAVQMYRKVHQAIKQGLLKSAHDLSEGGLGVALAECCIGSGLGACLFDNRICAAATACLTDEEPFKRELAGRLDLALFAEGPARLLVTIDAENHDDFVGLMKGFSCVELGQVSREAKLRFVSPDQKPLFSLGLDELRSAWEVMLPFD